MSEELQVPPPPPTEVQGLGNAIKFLDERQAKAQVSLDQYVSNFQELTGGYKPNQQINAGDVVKIFHAIYGEPDA